MYTWTELYKFLVGPPRSRASSLCQQCRTDSECWRDTYGARPLEELPHLQPQWPALISDWDTAVLQWQCLDIFIAFAMTTAEEWEVAWAWHFGVITHSYNTSWFFVCSVCSVVTRSAEWLWTLYMCDVWPVWPPPYQDPIQPGESSSSCVMSPSSGGGITVDSDYDCQKLALLLIDCFGMLPKNSLD